MSKGDYIKRNLALFALTTLVFSNLFAMPVFAQLDLSGYWKFEEGTGTDVADSSPYGNDGIIENTTNVFWRDSTECKYGNCLFFNNTAETPNVEDTGWVNVGNDTSLIPRNTFYDGYADFWSITITAWVKPMKNTTGWSSIITAGSAEPYDLYIYTGQSLWLDYYNETSGYAETGTVDDAMLLGQWYFVVAQYDNSTCNATLWIDGVQNTAEWGTETFCTIEPSRYTTRDWVTIGGKKMETGNNYGFNGYIDELRFYKTALTEEQFESLRLNNYICGDDICDIGETQRNCCQDCGAPSGYRCVDNELEGILLSFITPLIPLSLALSGILVVLVGIRKGLSIKEMIRTIVLIFIIIAVVSALVTLI